MHTRVSEMLGVEFPILAFSHCRDVVAAVTNAGGFGVLGAVAHSPEQLEIDLGWIEEQTKGRPYGLDLLLPQKYAGAEDGGLDREAVRQLLPAEQQQFVDDILSRTDLSPGRAAVAFSTSTLSLPAGKVSPRSTRSFFAISRKLSRAMMEALSGVGSGGALVDWFGGCD